MMPALLGQFPVNARGTVTLAMPGVDDLNGGQQRRIGAGTSAGRTLLPGMIARPCHLEDGAELRQGMFGAHGLDPLAAFLEGSVKMPSVFFRMSRCSRTRANSALSARFSADRSARSGVASP